MYDKFIKNYVDKMTLNDIFSFAEKENFKISKNDAEIVLSYIKKYWLTVYKGDPTNIFFELKLKLEESTYKKIIELYNKYKNKIS